MNKYLLKILNSLGLYQYFYWQKRGKVGRSAVLNFNYSEEQFNDVTKYHQNIYKNHITNILSSDDKRCLDFGCGIGRFSTWLADTFNLDVEGVDISSAFVETAIPHPKVKYTKIFGSKLPFENNQFDLIFVNLVLGGISERKLKRTISEILRTLSKDGKIILIENTAKLESNEKWFYRNEEYYMNLFKPIKLETVERYKEFDDLLSIFLGKK